MNVYSVHAAPVGEHNYYCEKFDIAFILYNVHDFGTSHCYEQLTSLACMLCYGILYCKQIVIS